MLGQNRFKTGSKFVAPGSIYPPEKYPSAGVGGISAI